MDPTYANNRPDQYYDTSYQYPQSSYSPIKPSHREHTEGKNLNYAKECYSHLSKVNLPEVNIDYKGARFFVIKSFMEDNVHKSMKYQVWSSTPEGNKRLNNAYIKSQEEKVPLFLLFSVNGSKQFIGVAKMVSEVNFTEKFALWDQNDKWVGKFKVEWIFIKDIPNREFKSILIPTNENKPITNMKDAQEIPYIQGMIVLKKFKEYNADTNMLDAFEHYDNEERKRKEEKPESFAKFPHEGGRGRGKVKRGRGRSGRHKETKKEANKDADTEGKSSTDTKKAQ